MTDFEDVQRHSDGSIDFDVYRARAAALRTDAKRNALRRTRVPKIVVTMLAALAAAISLEPTS